MKKIILAIAIISVLSLTAQQETNRFKESLIQTNTSEVLLQQKIDKEVNSINKNILENTKRTINNENKIDNLFITKVAFQGVLLSIVLALLGIFGLDKTVKRKFKKSIENVKEAEIRTIQHIKNSEKDNKELRGQSQILLVNEVTTPVNKDLKRLFIDGSSKVQFNCTEINIKELTYKQIKNALVDKGGLHPTDFELIIFDNSNADGRKWNQSYLEDYMIPLTKEFIKQGIGILYYSNDLLYPSYLPEYKSVEEKHLLTYANVVPHLYNNAMTLLKLQNLYKD